MWIKGAAGPHERFPLAVQTLKGLGQVRCPVGDRPALELAYLVSWWMLLGGLGEVGWEGDGRGDDGQVGLDGLA